MPSSYLLSTTKVCTLDAAAGHKHKPVEQPLDPQRCRDRRRARYPEFPFSGSDRPAHSSNTCFVLHPKVMHHVLDLVNQADVLGFANSFSSFGPIQTKSKIPSFQAELSCHAATNHYH
eukprot:7084-Pelagomonas_calceolata.AAC.1